VQAQKSADADLTPSEPPRASLATPIAQPAPVTQTTTTKPALVRPKPAAAQAEPAAKKPVEDIQPLLKQAASAFALGQSAEALAAYQRIVKIAPREAAAWRGLGVAAARLDRRAEAVRAFTRYLDLNPHAPDAARVRDQMEKLR
jgi:Flp pilus assembly protein TadD